MKWEEALQSAVMQQMKLEEAMIRYEMGRHIDYNKPDSRRPQLLEASVKQAEQLGALHYASCIKQEQSRGEC